MTRTRLFSIAAIALTLALPIPSECEASIIFSDNFNSENGGQHALNYTGFAHWTVSGGTVDLIGEGSSWDFFPDAGYGLYVDLDGSTSSAGVMTSLSLNLLAGNYCLSYDLAGSQRSGHDQGNTVDIEVTIKNVLQVRTLATFDPFTTFTESFSLAAPETIQIVFANRGGDNVGALLDNVVLSTVSGGAGPLVPEPLSLGVWGLLSACTAGLAAARRRRGWSDQSRQAIREIFR